MFHGTYADRESLLVRWSELPNDPAKEMEIVRNGYYVPDIYQPMIRPVVSAALRTTIEERFGDLAFLPVRFTKLVYYPFAAGDMGFYDSDEYLRWPSDAVKMHFLLPDVPELHRSVPRCYEMSFPALGDLIAGNPDTKLTVVRTMPFWSHQEEEFVLSPALIEQHHIVFCGSVLLAEPLFQVIAPFVDWDYFDVDVITV